MSRRTLPLSPDGTTPVRLGVKLHDGLVDGVRPLIGSLSREGLVDVHHADNLGDNGNLIAAQTIGGRPSCAAARNVRT